MEEIDRESMKHMCRLCNKSFPCGRSLGGHMRSHVINSTDHHRHQKLTSLTKNGGWKNNKIIAMNASFNSNDSCYELRKDPRKTFKSEDSSEVGNNRTSSSVLDKLCKECGKGFQSWKALFGHMKCHSNKVPNNKNSSAAGSNQDSWTSRSDNENLGAKNRRTKRSRSRDRRNKRYIVTSTTTATTTASSSISMNANSNQISSNNASTSVVSEIEQQQEAEIAMCLMMLSRDVGKWDNKFESSDHCNPSVLVNVTRVEGKKLIGNGSKMKKLAKTQVGFDFLGRSEVGCKKFEKNMMKRDEFDDRIESSFGEFADSSKRKFECVSCNKSFHSYQALGGHKASHRKLKGYFDLKTQNENKPMLDHEQTINGYDQKTYDDHQESSSFNLGVGCLKKTVVLGAHECPVCLKMFPSGQALGGHRRSHLIAEAQMNQENNMTMIKKLDEPIHEIRGFLDLNKPPEEEDMIMSYWEDSSDHRHHNHESTLLGLLSTS